MPQVLLCLTWGRPNAASLQGFAFLFDAQGQASCGQVTTKHECTLQEISVIRDAVRCMQKILLAVLDLVRTGKGNENGKVSSLGFKQGNLVVGLESLFKMSSSVESKAAVFKDL
jgi:hypothetical protein